MLGMLSFLFLLCAAAFVVFTALLIIRSVKKQPKKPFVIMAAASFILAIGLTMPISSLYKPSEKTSDGITPPPNDSQSAPETSINASDSESATDVALRESGIDADTEPSTEMATLSTKSTEDTEKAEHKQVEKERVENGAKEKAKHANNEPIKQENVSESNSDLEIITRENHPLYYGSVDQSHTVWDDVTGGKIVFADGYDKYQDSTIIYMDAYRNSDLIRNIEIYFSNFEKPVNYSAKDILPIVASYMPFDIIEKYYNFDKSEKLLPNKKNTEKTSYYIITYSLTSDASNAYYSGEHEYSGSIDVIMTINEDKKVESFRIGFGTPRWMSSLSMNGYYTKSWKCNLKDYLGG